MLSLKMEANSEYAGDMVELIRGAIRMIERLEFSGEINFGGGRISYQVTGDETAVICPHCNHIYDDCECM